MGSLDIGIGTIKMDQGVLDEDIRIEPVFDEATMGLLAFGEGGEVGTSFEQEGEGVIVRWEGLCVHVIVEKYGLNGVWAGGISSKHGVASEG